MMEDLKLSLSFQGTRCVLVWTTKPAARRWWGRNWAEIDCKRQAFSSSTNLFQLPWTEQDKTSFLYPIFLSFSDFSLHLLGEGHATRWSEDNLGTLWSFLYHVGPWWWAPLVCLAIILLLAQDKMFLEFFSLIPHTVPPKCCQALRPPLSRTEKKFTSWLRVATQGGSQWPLQIMCMIPGGWHFSILSGFIPCSVSAAYGWWINGFPMWTRALSPRYPWV